MTPHAGSGPGDVPGPAPSPGGADGGSAGTIAQAEVDILASDTSDILRDRIRQAENILYPAVVEFFARERPHGG